MFAIYLAGFRIENRNGGEYLVLNGELQEHQDMTRSYGSIISETGGHIFKKRLIKHGILLQEK